MKNANTLIQEAAIFAENAHRFRSLTEEKKLRKYTGDPYFVHPKTVARIVAHVTNDPEVIAAALLHDTLEDTEATAEEIRETFGERVLGLVLEVTEISKLSDGNRKFRKEMDRQHFAKASPEGQTIKLADLIDNTASIVKHDPHFAKVYLREKAELLEVLTKGDPKLMRIARIQLGA